MTEMIEVCNDFCCVIGMVSPPGAKYYGVKGQVVRGRGLQAIPGQVYCKVRIDK